MAEYKLGITFRSNERPYSTDYRPYPADRFGDDDDSAKAWAIGMQNGLWGYDVTLFKDGVVLPFGECDC